MTIIKATLRGVAEMDRIEAPLDGAITSAAAWKDTREVIP
jgi:hypothetical protein